MVKIELPERRKVKHLTLLRRSRTISAREFNALSFDERLQMVGQVPGAEKFKMIIEANDSERLVQALAPQEIYLLSRDLGMYDATDLLVMASPAQWTAFFDLDCWQIDFMDEKKSLSWLKVLVTAGEERIVQTAQKIPFILLSLIIKKLAVVVKAPGMEDDDDLGDDVPRDLSYQLAYESEEISTIVEAFLNPLIARDESLYVRLLESIRWEPQATLEEEVYQERNQRLQGWGFPDPADVAAVYATIDPDQFALEDYLKPEGWLETDENAPCFPVVAARPGALLEELFSEGIDNEMRWELTFLVNRVMMADRIDIGDSEVVNNSMLRIYGYINIALETLCGSDIEKARELFTTIYLSGLFRLGYSYVAQLQQQAAKIRKSVEGKKLGGIFLANFEAVSAARPEFFIGLEDPSRAGTRPFARWQDVERCRHCLDGADAACELFRGPFAGFIQEDETSLAELFLTALANRLLNKPFVPTPLAEKDLPLLVKMITSKEGALHVKLREETLNWLETLQKGISPFAGLCLEDWEEELCPLAGQDIQGRYISSVLVEGVVE